jgi:hypothetical protein
MVRRSRKRRRPKRRLPKARARNARQIRLLSLSPHIHKTFNTGELDHVAYNDYTNALSSTAITSTVSGFPGLQVNDPLYIAGRIVGSFSDVSALSDIKGSKVIVGNMTTEVEFQNTGRHDALFECWKFKPRMCIGEEIFHDFSASIGNMPDLVDKLMAADVVDMTTEPLLYNPLSSGKVQSTFKLIKQRKFNLAPGKSVKFLNYGKKYQSFDGDKLQNNGELFYSPKYFTFWYIRVRGGLVHDTTSDNLVGTGKAHVVWIAKSTMSLYKTPTDKREVTTNYNVDTITAGEAVGDDDHKMVGDGED